MKEVFEKSIEEVLEEMDKELKEVVVVKYVKEEKEIKGDLLENWSEMLFKYMIVDRRGYEVFSWLKRYWSMELLNVYEGILENERDILKRKGISVDVMIVRYEDKVWNYGQLMRKNRKWLFEVVRWLGVKVEEKGYSLNWKNFEREELIEMIWYYYREKEMVR